MTDSLENREPGSALVSGSATRWTVIPPDGGGGGVSAHSHVVVPLWDLLGPVGMHPGHSGHVASVHHGDDPVLYAQLADGRKTGSTGVLSMPDRMYVQSGMDRTHHHFC